MSTASRIIQLLNDRVSQELLGRISILDGHEIEIASQMFDALKSILTSSSYDHEYGTTLDYSTPNTEIDACEEDPDEPITDQDYEEPDSETPVYESFSFGYMKQAIEFYDDIDQKTGKRKHNWKNVKHQFRRIPYQYYLARFRTYIQESGAKKQKNDSAEDFVYDKFERARELL